MNFEAVIFVVGGVTDHCPVARTLTCCLHSKREHSSNILYANGRNRLRGVVSVRRSGAAVRTRFERTSRRGYNW